LNKTEKQSLFTSAYVCGRKPLNYQFMTLIILVDMYTVTKYYLWGIFIYLLSQYFQI